MSLLRYGRTTWTLTKCMKKKLDRNYTRILFAVLNKCWRQHSTKQQLYGHLLPILKTIQGRWTRYAGDRWGSKDILLWTTARGWARVGRSANTPFQRSHFKDPISYNNTQYAKRGFLLSIIICSFLRVIWLFFFN